MHVIHSGPEYFCFGYFFPPLHPLVYFILHSSVIVVITVIVFGGLPSFAFRPTVLPNPGSGDGGGGGGSPGGHHSMFHEKSFQIGRASLLSQIVAQTNEIADNVAACNSRCKGITKR